ncbi:MAG: cytidylate kinase-like family protein [Treponema sp.]|uniref:cytidylate kinase-like family protein n=1 Tax=Treponema sp. TaxID=166 RepID=UPI002A91AF78|nr:cytidylate kinase-like family protein [Treponema sp.]MDY6396125.1 cytidylate kinase-like family protein [Treponema sp.]
MAIVTLTRQSGSFGDEIGMLIARRLGYTFFDKHEIERRIIAKGLPKEEFIKYDERKPTFLARYAKNRDRYLNFLSSVVLEIAKEGNCVIIGRGAFLFLRDVPNHIALRFVAPFEERIKHMMELKNIETEKAAQLLLEKSDKRKVAFYKSCFKYDLNSYDFIHASINTGMIHPDMVAEMVAAGINNNITPEIEEAGKQRVGELILAQEMANKLIFEHGLHIDELWVIVRDKNITLHGVTSFHATVERAETILESEYSGYKVVSEIKCVQDNRFSKA